MSVLPETILQFGAGRFLRAFFDRFVQQANESGQAVGRIVIVQSTPGARADLLKSQPEGYNVLVRGIENGTLVQRIQPVRCISRALSASKEWAQVLELACSPHLRMIVSNATESGYILDETDRLDSAPPWTLAGKLVQVLWARFSADLEPVVVLPCELFERNATRLLELVLTQAGRWSLPEDFTDWVKDQCWWLHTLVDCIITDGPPDHPLAATDKLLVCAEPYALLAVEQPSRGEPPLFEHSAIRVVPDLLEYHLPKVRILNGVHTAMVGKFLGQGFETVQQVIADPKAGQWVQELLDEEIVPVVAQRVPSAAAFARQTMERFRNPFLAHKLKDIALNHEDKVRLRLQPTRAEYEKLFGKPPAKLIEALGKYA